MPRFVDLLVSVLFCFLELAHLDHFHVAVELILTVFDLSVKRIMELLSQGFKMLDSNTSAAR